MRVKNADKMCLSKHGCRLFAVPAGTLLCICAAAFLECSYHELVPMDIANVNIYGPWEDEAVIIQSDSTWCDVLKGDKANAILEKKVTWYLVNKENPPDLKTITVTDHPFVEERPRIEIGIYYKDGTVKKVPETEIRRRKANDYSNDLLIHADNDFCSTFILPRYQKGMRVRLSVERRTFRPEFASMFPLRNNFCTYAGYWRFTWPVDFDLKHGVANGEGMQVDTSFVDSGASRVFSVTLKEHTRFLRNAG